LIALCDELVANRTAWLTLMVSRNTAEDERRTQPENDRLCGERGAILDRIEAAGAPTTAAGAQAVARAALADAERGWDGHWEAREHCERLAMLAAAFLAGPGFDDPLVRLTRASIEAGERECAA